ncbi:MAG: hypothetical protein JXA18_03925 [Chitinispirillaceae bacterium]|nr:hypothetical protein [Chitinispirillaceae bacterium]
MIRLLLIRACIGGVLLSVLLPGAHAVVDAGYFHETDRMSVVLEGGWKFLFTGDDASVAYVHSAPPDSCKEIALPHVFPSVKPNGAPVSGYGWYFRKVAVPDSFSGKDLFLEFEGVCLHADVFVNGKAAHGRTFAYMPFSVDLNPFLHDTTPLRVAVRVDSRLHSRCIPDVEAKGWWIYGGIRREVALVGRPKRRIGGVRIRTVHRRKDRFDLHCVLTPVGGVLWDSVAVVVLPEGGKRASAAFTMVTTDTAVRLSGVRAWTPEDPYRYQLRFTPYFGAVRGATAAFRRGFCQLTAGKSRLFLNGAPYYLRGMARHDLRSFDGRPLARKERREDLADMKATGVNFLRIAHFPQHRDVYELCDSIGLLVMDEIPAWKTEPKFLGSKEGREYGTAYMHDLIEAHGNYGCIGIWSAGNQFKSYKTSVADYVGTLAAAVKKEDSSRLFTFCSYHYFWDKAFFHVDVIAVNEYFGWELASLDLLPPMLEKIRKEWPDKPVIVSEIGAQAQRGIRNPGARLAGPVKSMLYKDISEDHQALYIGSHMDTIWNRRGFIGGMVVWAYGDYMANLDKKRTPDMPRGLNSCGVVTADRKRKMAYDAVKLRYTLWREASTGRKRRRGYGK